MKFSLFEKAASRLYYFASGTSASHMRYRVADLDFHLADLRMAVETLGAYMNTEIQNWPDLFAETNDARNLADLLNHYGSDKASRHNYQLIYAWLLDRTSAFEMLEIGLGTNDPELRSTMGVNGRPGASLRAFRDWAPRCKVFGADVDTRILFTEERIETYFVDQTDPATLTELGLKLPPLDLIIDDGLHTPGANMNVINFAMPLLKPGGVLVIEDISPVFLPFWRVAIPVLSRDYDCKLVQMKFEVAAILKKRS